MQEIEAKISVLLLRLLGRYGVFKYRHLLPVYRLFGVAPRRQKAAGPKQPATTLRVTQRLLARLNRSVAAAQWRQLPELVERVKRGPGAIIFLPSVGWKIPLAQRPHHLAREFAQRGYIVFFDCNNAYDDVVGFHEAEPNLILFRGDEALLHAIPDPLLWAVSYNFDRRDAYPEPARTVYDWIDDFDVFPYERAFLERNHERAMREAVVVASVARPLHEQARRARPDALYLPNGVEYGHFAGEKIGEPRNRVAARLRREGKPVAGYYGALAEWFDYELLLEVARRRPDWNFLLIGPMYDDSLRQRGRRLKSMDNVHWIGPRPYAALPGYLKLFDVATIPFVINDITRATSPLKLYEYFAGGKPVVTTPMPECEAFPEVHIARTAEEFSAALDAALAEASAPDFQSRRRRLGESHSWSARADQFLEHLRRTQSMRA